MRRLLFIVLLLALFCGSRVDAAVVAAPYEIVVSPSTINGLSNAVTSANALTASSSQPVKIILQTGLYTNNGPLVLSPNVSISGAGPYVTYLYGTNGLTGLIRPKDNCFISDIYVENTFTNDFGAVIVPFDSASATNVVFRNCILKGASDCIYSTVGTFIDGAIDSSQSLTFYNCWIQSKWDCMFITAFNSDDSPGLFRFIGCDIVSKGPLRNISGNNGEVGNCKPGGTNNVFEFTACRFFVSGATNLLTGAQVTQGGRVTFNACTWNMDTNGLVTGSVGAFAVYGTNTAGGSSVVIFDGCYPTNRCTGDATFIYRALDNRDAGASTVATGANTTETDLMSYTILSGTLHGNLQSLEVKAWGTFGANANGKAVRIKLGAASGSGGLTLMDTGARTNGGKWYIEGIITRASVSSLKAAFRCDATAPSYTTNDYQAVTLSTTTNNFLRLTGSNHTSTASDIVLEGYKIKWRP